jgi:hypothetical protein
MKEFLNFKLACAKNLIFMLIDNLCRIVEDNQAVFIR